MRLFVTGGAGFIGSAFVKEAIRRTHNVLIVDALTYAGDLRTIAGVCDHVEHRFARGHF